MIVVEGLDNTGKTTLVSKVLEEFPELIYRPSIGNKHDLNVIQEQAHDEAFFWDKLKYTIADRSRLISEFIYNPVLQGRALAFTFHSFLEMFGSFLQQENLVILCHRNRLQLGSTFDEREQLSGVRQHLGDLDNQYSALYHTIHFLTIAAEGHTEVMKWSFEQHSDTIVYNAVRRYIDRVKGAE